MCKWGNDVLVKVKIPADLSHTGKAYWTKKGIDKCIAPIVKTLTNAGIYTAGSCCGHGKNNGYIALHDHRVLIIKNIEDSLACTLKNELRCWEGEVCKKCKRDQRLAWCIKDDKWNAVVSTKYRNRVLCLECFLALADKKNIEIKVSDFIFFGWVGTNVKGDTLIDRNRISPKWSKLAENWLGDKNGKHCHWCKCMKSEDGEVRCTNKKSKFCDGDRIRSWDGLYCAKECGCFELNDWYTDDKNYDEYFKKEK